jgi:hypothetical protein
MHDHDCRRQAKDTPTFNACTRNGARSTYTSKYEFSHARRGNEKRRVHFFFLVWNGMEAIGARAYGAVVWRQLPMRIGRPLQEAPSPSFRYKKGNTCYT